MFLITAANKNYIPQRSLGIRIHRQSFSEIFTPVAILDTMCKDVIIETISIYLATSIYMLDIYIIYKPIYIYIYIDR